MNYRSLIIALHIPLLSLLIPFSAKAAGGNLAGTYRMEIRIGERDFTDILVIKGDRELAVSGHSGPITGTLEVPGVFIAALEGGSFCLGAWVAKCRLEFAIVARENGEDFKVHYRAQLANYFEAYGGAAAILKGHATLENGALLGNFTATQQRP